MAEGGGSVHASESKSRICKSSKNGEESFEKSACYLLFRSNSKFSENNESSPSTSNLGLNNLTQCSSGNEKKDSKWSCRLCKFLNVAATEQCIICSSWKPQVLKEVNFFFILFLWENGRTQTRRGPQ